MYPAQLQMRRKDFERDNITMASIAVIDLKHAIGCGGGE